MSDPIISIVRTHLEPKGLLVVVIKTQAFLKVKANLKVGGVTQPPVFQETDPEGFCLFHFKLPNPSSWSLSQVKTISREWLYHSGMKVTLELTAYQGTAEIWKQKSNLPMVMDWLDFFGPLVNFGLSKDQFQMIHDLLVYLFDLEAIPILDGGLEQYHKLVIALQRRIDQAETR